MLSSWTSKKLPLEQWITEELQAKYDIPSQIGEEWVKASQLLLLLDGLDEVAPSGLPACIEAINGYYYQAHRSLVVCSRTKEFLDQPGRLALHRAVIVQPLSSEQVDSYLDGLTAKREEVEGLKHILQQSEALRALATTPLFLTVLILAYIDFIASSDQ
jgi:predicted NACHT family NTPase